MQGPITRQEQKLDKFYRQVPDFHVRTFLINLMHCNLSKGGHTIYKTTEIA